jgi:hypothetical protein
MMCGNPPCDSGDGNEGKGLYSYFDWVDKDDVKEGLITMTGIIVLCVFLYANYWMITNLSSSEAAGLVMAIVYGSLFLIILFS